MLISLFSSVFSQPLFIRAFTALRFFKENHSLIFAFLTASFGAISENSFNALICSASVAIFDTSKIFARCSIKISFVTSLPCLPSTVSLIPARLKPLPCNCSRSSCAERPELSCVFASSSTVCVL